MSNVTLVFLVVVAVGFALYFQIQRLTQNIDQNSEDNAHGRDFNSRHSSPNNALLTHDNKRRYKDFCEVVDEKIRYLRNVAKNGCKDGLQEPFLATLSELSHRLVLLEAAELNNEQYEEQLFEILSKLEDAVDESLIDAEAINTQIKDELRVAFDRFNM